MNEKELINQKIDIIKTEYQVLLNRNENLLEQEWKVRQFSFTLWLAAIGVGLGLQGNTSNNLYILICSVFIPIIFLYMDARLGRWYYGHRARVGEIQKFFSDKKYTVPLTGKPISFKDFSSSLERTYDFPVLDSSGNKTCSSVEYELLALNGFPHMVEGIRRYFYHSQILLSLVVVSIQIFSITKLPLSFLLILGSPTFYLLLYFSVVIKRKALSKKFSNLANEKKVKKTRNK